MIRRITIALLSGVVVAVVLELLNGFFTFLLPPLIVITPLCLFVAIVVAVSGGSRSHSDA
jgi:hypothetical protein